MKNKLWMGIFCMLACAAFLGAQSAKINPKKVTGSVVGSFGFDLFESLYKEKKHPVAISPMSIAEAVTMVTWGADEDKNGKLSKTKAQLEGLFISDRLRELHGFDLEMLTQELVGIRKDLEAFAENSPGIFEYSSANSIWANNNPAWKFQFSEYFEGIATDEKLYGAEVFERDFAATEKDAQGKKVQKTVKEVNEWVSEKTKEKITKLLSELNDDDVAVLLNAIYAKGKFKNHFNSLSYGKYQTQDSNKPEEVSFMTQKNKSMDYYENKDLKMVSLKIEENSAYKKPKPMIDQVAIDILIPADGDLGALVKKLDEDCYYDIVEGLKPDKVELTIAAGKVEQDEPAKLKDILREEPFLVKLPFDGDAAEFGRIGGVKNKANIYINDILTKTFYEVTPFGFEAAAATAVIMAARSSAPRPVIYKKVKADSPSLHVIRHIPSGLPLFIIEYDSPVRYSHEEIADLIWTGSESERSLSAKVEDGQIISGGRDKDFKFIVALYKDDKIVKTFTKPE